MNGILCILIGIALGIVVVVWHKSLCRYLSQTEQTSNNQQTDEGLRL